MSDAAELPGTFVASFHNEPAVRRMTYRELPHYGAVSIMSFGASGLGGMHTAGKGTGLQDATGSVADTRATWFAEEAPEDIAAARELVHTALKAGVNLIDTAHWYGQGKSERLLGHALKDVPRRAFFINTKVGRFDKDPLQMFDFTAERVYQSVLDSLRRLQLDYIDSVQLHDPEFAPSIDVIVEQALPALDRARREGKIRLIGMTGYPLAVQRQIIERSPVAINTSLSYCHYSLNDTSLVSSGFVDFCAERNIALINASPISMGLLMERDPPSWHPAAAATKALCVEAVKHCKSQGVDISKIAQAFTLAEERISTTLVSTTNVVRLRKNIDAASRSAALDEVEAAALAHVRERIFQPAGDHRVLPQAAPRAIGSLARAEVRGV